MGDADSVLDGRERRAAQKSRFLCSQAPDAVKKLIDDFDRLKAGAIPQDFDEASLRQSFINPLWEALGWNLRDPREVIVEKRVHIRDSTKYADYCFQLGGRPQFVIETKDFRKHLEDADFIFQTKRYGYNLPVDFAILTNFARFRLYDTGLQPSYENPARGLIKQFDLPYQDYVIRWEELAGAFSREAVAQGDLKKLLPAARRDRNKEALDRKFFEGLNAWRAELARVIALRNADLSVREINEAVQRLLDRIVFMRVIEDRNIEAVELLLDALNRWKAEREKPLYRYLVDKFRYLEPQYNGELFSSHFSEDLLLDDKPLKDFVESLYYPRCPYQFNVVGVEMLGTIYERFLGSTIHLTEKHRAVVEEKPEVRKAGGVYYTPKYIVDYIVESTVGELLKKCKTPADVAKLKILDPACGSGSFLLGAFQRLIAWNEEYFSTHPEKISRGFGADCWRDEASGRWRLSPKFKRRILINNIFGVDLDPQACEVTRMSLYLKLLDDVEALFLIKAALLPPLQNNIKCGNSIIGPDYWDFVRGAGKTGGTLPLPFEVSDEERRRINPFDWEVEFDAVIKAGGFDAVIGNPPYVRQEGLGDEKAYYAARYETFVPTADLYVNFVEKALRLTRPGGRFGFIVSNKWMRARYGERLRRFVKRFQIQKLVDFGELKVFQDAATFPLVVIISNAPRRAKPWYAPVKRLDFDDLAQEVTAVGYELDDSALADEGFTLVGRAASKLLNKIKAAGIPLGDYVHGKIYRGVLTGFNEAFVIDRATRDALIKKDKASAEIIKPFVVGDDVRRYHVNFRERYLLFTRHGIDIDRYPAIKEYLVQWKKELTPKSSKNDSVGRKSGTYKWYEIQDTVDYYPEFEKPKIIWPEIAKESRFAWENNAYFYNKTCFIMPSSDHYLLGLLNSKLVWYFLLRICPVLGDPDKKGRLTQQSVYVKQIPVRSIKNKDNEIRSGNIANLAAEMISLHQRLASAKAEADRLVIERQIKASDKKIDQLVYELYGLTDEEIRIIDESA